MAKDRLCKVAQLYTPNSGRGPRMNFRGQIGEFHKGEHRKFPFSQVLKHFGQIYHSYGI